MLAARVRSGLTETFHEGAAAVCDSNGATIAHYGDIDRPFYLRSSAKPFQAYVSQRSGAGLAPIELAQASASHRGLPVHVAMVRSMLVSAGLDESALQCPPDWPLWASEERRLVRSGESVKRRIWHNCSGKHAGFLRACVAQGWPVDTYLDPNHPLQVQVVELVSELGRFTVEPVGVDGCGAPVLRTTVRAMARMFSHLGADEEFSDVFTAMHRYPALIAATGQPDTSIAVAINAAAKGGAEGCVGVALSSGLGIGVKSWDGLFDVAGVGVVSVLEQIGALTSTARAFLSEVANPRTVGGGRTVGALESRFELSQM